MGNILFLTTTLFSCRIYVTRILGENLDFKFAYAFILSNSIQFNLIVSLV